MHSCLKYFNIFQLKQVLRIAVNPPSINGIYSSKSRFGYVKCKLDFSRNLSSDICRKNFIPFEELVEKRRAQARSSIIVEIRLEDQIANVDSLCSKFGNIKSIIEFKSTGKRMILVEFDDENSVKEIFHQIRASSNEGTGTLLQTPFLKLNNGFKLSKFQTSELDTEKNTLTDKSENNIPNTSEMLDAVKSKCSNVSEQIQYLYDTLKMRDLSWRLRFLTCRKVEWALPSVLSHLRVVPFGSSVNTFGHNNCDLDMIIDFSSSLNTDDKHCPFTFQQKSVMFREKTLNIIADLLMYYVPGFDKIWKIPHASVPIIKCKEVFIELDCDISLANMSGYYMSEILYLYGCSDPRVRPLVFCIRLWAKEKGLTRKDQPGMWFSNFTMTMLVLFFLMNSNSAVIPTLLKMKKLSNSSFTCDGIHYDYIRDVNGLPESSNNQTLEQLLIDFFTFYATFDYKKAISLITGKTFQKVRKTALYIENPLEMDLNIAKCVRYEHLECFKEECDRALSILSEYNNTNFPDCWGLSTLLKNNNNSYEVQRIKPLNLNTVFRKGQNENVNNQQGGISGNSSKNKASTYNNPPSAKANVNSYNKNDSRKGKSRHGRRPSYQF